MTSSRLELISSRGDESIGQVRFVLHGTPSLRDANSMMSSGIKFVEGGPLVSTNIVHAYDWTVNPEKQGQLAGGGAVAGEPGMVLVCAVPSNFHVGYGVFTTAYIDRALKLVSGSPMRYAGARKQLAFYMSSDTEAARVQIEAEVANGFPLVQRPQFVLGAQNIVGSFEQNPGFTQLISQLQVGISSLQPIEFERMEASLRDVFKPRIAADEVLVPTVMRDILVGTAESIIMSRLRMLRWQGLAMLGYVFHEGQQTVAVEPVADAAEQRRIIDDFGRQLASSSIFSAELSWLKAYAARELELMRVELDGAELEALPD